MIEIKLTGRRYVAIALLGDRQSHHADGSPAGGSQRAFQRGGVRGIVRAGDGNGLDHRSDQPALDLFALAQFAAIVAALRAEAGGKIRRAQIDAEDAPWAESRLQRVVGVFGLVATMKRADAEMQDAGREPCPVVAGPANGGRQAVEGRRA